MGLSIRQVADRVGWGWGRVQRRLQKAGVTRTIGEAVHLAKRVGTINGCEALIELVDGLLLGDGSIEASRFGGRLTLGQSGHHQPWVHDLHSQFRDLGVTSTLRQKPGRKTRIKGSLVTRKSRTSLRTATYPWFLYQRQRWYPDGVKRVPSDVRLSPVSLAAWVCGDGVRAGGGYRMEFCSDGFLPQDVELLAEMLAKRFGWRPTISHRNRLVLCRQSDRDGLLTMVKPYVPGCFQHKLALKARSDYFKLADRQGELRSLREQGWSIDRLATHFSMSRSGIYSALAKMGLTGKRVPRCKGQW